MEILGKKKENSIKRYINKTSNNLKLRIAIMQKDKYKITKLWENQDLQNSNTELFPQIVEILKGDSRRLADLWKTTCYDVQNVNKGKFSKIIEYTKDSLLDIKEIWQNTKIKESNPIILEQFVDGVKESSNTLYNSWLYDTSRVVKEQNPQILSKVIEYVKTEPKYVEGIWLDASDKVKEENTKLFQDVVEYVKEEPELVDRIWRNASDKVKEENINLKSVVNEARAEILEKNIVDEHSDIKYWIISDKEVQRLKPELFNIIIRGRANYEFEEIWANTDESIQIKNENLLKQKINHWIRNGMYNDLIGKVWKNTSKEVQADIIIDCLHPNTWKNTDKEVQESIIDEVIKLYEKVDSYYLTIVLKETNNELLETKIIKIMDKIKENQDNVGILWSNIDKEIQRTKILEIIEKYKENSTFLVKIWRETNKEIQKENARLLPKIIDIVKDNPEEIQELWITTDKEVQKENANLFPEITELVKKNSIYLVILWNNTDKEVQKENANLFPEMLEATKAYPDSVVELWKNTDKGLQEIYFADVIEMIKNNPDNVVEMCRNTDHEIVSENFRKTYEIVNKNSELSEKFENRMKSIIGKNVNIFNTLNWDFLEIAQKENYTDEQILRITNYENVQDYLVQNSDNTYVNETINYLLENDTNWIISMDKIIKHKDKYHELLSDIKQNGEMEVTEEFIQQLITIISDTENYFDINNYEDVNNYYNKRNDTCLKIFDGNFENISEQLKGLSEGDLYKFALLEYKFGISLDDAKRMVERYGADAKELPKGTLKDYLILLEDIINHDNIEGIIEKAKENKTLNEPWLGFPNARNAEEEILNLYAELYNETLYQTKESDKNEKQETYIDKDRHEHKIDVYNLKNDFNINIRVEGAYREFKEPKNFVDYYNNPNINNHGNCESYIGNDQIASARNSIGVVVGYNHIQKNQLTACGPFDLGSGNEAFSIFNEKSQFRTPKQMIDNTRHAHNEMVKDRIVIDENGNIEKYKPDYAIWIEEDTIEERKEPGWQEKRDKDSQWIMTKKLAAQLGIPIVVIDREHYAQREMEKVDLLQKLITGEEIDKEKYGKYIEEFRNLSKAELVKELITKYENNRVGLQFSEKLWFEYFPQDRFESIMKSVFSSIENNLSQEEKNQVLNEVLKVAIKEERYMENNRLADVKIKVEKERAKMFYATIESKCKELTQTQAIQNEKTNNEQAQNNIELRKMLELYFEKDINYDDLNEQKRKLIKDMELVKQGERGQN